MATLTNPRIGFTLTHPSTDEVLVLVGWASARDFFVKTGRMESFGVLGGQTMYRATSRTNFFHIAARFEEVVADRLILTRAPEGWVVTYVGKQAAEILSLFGTDTIPTSFTALAPAGKVLDHIRLMNPGSTVEVA